MEGGSSVSAGELLDSVNRRVIINDSWMLKVLSDGIKFITMNFMLETNKYPNLED